MLLILVAMQGKAQQFGVEMNLVNNLPYIGINAGYESKHIVGTFSVSTNYVKLYTGYRKQYPSGLEMNAGAAYRRLWFIDEIEVGAEILKVPRNYNTLIASSGLSYNIKKIKIGLQVGVESILKSRTSPFVEVNLKYKLNS